MGEGSPRVRGHQDVGRCACIAFPHANRAQCGDAEPFQRFNPHRLAHALSPSDHPLSRPAAIDNEVLPGDIGGGRRRQKNPRAYQVFGGPPTAQAGMLAPSFVLFRVGEALSVISV